MSLNDASEMLFICYDEIVYIYFIKYIYCILADKEKHEEFTKS
jgi:hypothetical protein